MALKIGRMGRLVRPKPKFLDSWESNHLSKAALKRSLNFSIFITTSGTLILAHCVNLSPFLYIGNRYLHVSAIEKEFVQQKFSEAILQYEKLKKLIRNWKIFEMMGMQCRIIFQLYGGSKL